MRNTQTHRRLGFWLVIVGYLSQTVMGAQPAIAPNPAPNSVTVRDVALGTGRTLTGRVVDGHAQPKQDVAVVLEQNAQVIAQLSSNSGGQFQFANLNEGVYGLHVNGQRQEIRVWNQASSPPTAVDVLQVPTGEIVRGQSGGRLGGAALRIGIAAGIATAIVLPIALSDNKDAS